MNKTKTKIKKIVRILSIFIVAFCISQSSGWTSAYAVSLLHNHDFSVETTSPTPATIPWPSGDYADSRDVCVDTSSVSGSTAKSMVTRQDFSPTSANVGLALYFTTYSSSDCTTGSLTSYSTFDNDVASSGGFTPANYVSGFHDYVWILNSGSPSTGITLGSSIKFHFSALSSSNQGGTVFTLKDKGDSLGNYAYNIDSALGAIFPAPIVGEVATNSIVVTTPAPYANYTSPYDVYFSGRYSYDSTTSANAYDMIGYEVVNINSLNVTVFDPESLVDGTPTNFGFYQIGTPDSTYSFRAYFYDSTDPTVPRLYSDIRYFSTDDGGGIEPLTGNPEEVCKGTVGSLYLDAIPCYLRNFAIWLFVPTSASVVDFQSLTLANTFPFSYIYDIGTAYNELFSNSGSMDYAVSVNTGALGTISFISASQISAVPYASTIKTLLGYILWFYTGMFLYRLILRAHD